MRVGCGKSKQAQASSQGALQSHTRNPEGFLTQSGQDFRLLCKVLPTWVGRDMTLIERGFLGEAHIHHQAEMFPLLSVLEVQGHGP